MHSPAVLHILATGGTIAGMADAAAPSGYRAAALSVEALLESVPPLQALLTQKKVRLQTRQLLQKDSKDLDAADWLSIAHAVRQAQAEPQCAGVLITHGTDTLEETAWFLHRTLPPAASPVLLVSSMRAATALCPDGPQNLLDACVAALSGLGDAGDVDDSHGLRAPRLNGVLAVAAGAIHHAVHVQKTQAWHIPAFDSAPAGPLGWVEQGRVRLAWGQAAEPDWPASSWPAGAHRAVLDVPEAQALAVLPAVASLSSHAGFDARQVQALCAAGFDGLLIAATGDGTLHHALEAALAALPKNASAPAIALTSRCTLGHLASPASAWPHIPLPAPKARLELLLRLWRQRVER